MVKDTEFLKKTIKKDLQAEAIQSTSEKLGEIKEFKESIPKKRKKSFLRILLPLIFIFVIIIGFLLIFTYLFYANSLFSSKTFVEKPILEDSLGEGHISYILNELGAWRLHKKPFGRTAQMEIRITDHEKKFTATIIQGVPKILRSEAPRADLVIEMGFTEVKKIYLSKTPLATARKLVKNRDLKIIRTSPKGNLVLKGYKHFYNNLSKENIGFIHIFVFNETIKAFIYFLIVILVSMFSFYYLRNNKLFD